MRLRVVLAAAVSLGLAGSALAQGADLAAFTAFGGTDVQLERGVRVLGGDLGSNGRLSLSTDVTTAGGVAANMVRGARGVVVQGGVAYNVLSSNGGSFLGLVVTPIAIPILVLPAPPAIPATPLVNQDLAPGTVTTLTPGGYHRIRVARQVTLTMLAGTYDVDELRIKGVDTVIRCDPNPPSPPGCVIRVRTKLVLGASALGEAPSLPFTFEYAGTRGVAVSRAAGHMTATVTAPLAKVTLKSGSKAPSTFVGQLVGARVTIQQGATVSLVPGSAPSCGDGVLQPPEQCDPPSDAACPGACLPSCECSSGGAPILRAVGPGVLNNATSFGVQVFGANFLPGAQLELRDAVSTR